MNDREAILAAIDDFTTAYNTGDLDSLLAYYADDLVKVRQGAAPESRKDVAIRVREIFDRYRTDVYVENAELVVSGDFAFTRGSFRVTLTPHDSAEPRQFTRRYLEVWRKRDGVWKVVRAMDNEEAG